MTLSIKILLSFLERKILADLLPEHSNRLKLESKNGRVVEFTLDESQAILKALKTDHGDSMHFEVRAMESVTERLSKAIEDSQGIGAIPIGKRLYQFKITLNDSEPTIWRRIQVRECTLDKLHEHIQTAMGWTNSHLHRFRVNEKIYGDPELLDDGFEDDEPFIDSTMLKISKIVPKDGKQMRFVYEYDFGDGWRHDVLFEGCLSIETGVRYPICLEGDRNCPPEDVGGMGGYAEYLEALADPSHEQHDEMLQWRGQFDPEAFDAMKVTRRMQRGLPNWRKKK